MFNTLLIANRGEIAVRIMRTARRMGLRTVAVYSDVDRDALHVAMADAAYRIGAAPSVDSYLNSDSILAAAKASGADAIHPGYGFLSENADFAEAVAAAGIVFVGAPAAAIRAMGLKDAAKALMEASGVPVVPGYHGDKQSVGFLAKQAAAIGFPVLIKARAGGGGKGMRRVDRAEDFGNALESAQREAQASFGDGRVLIERYVRQPRHIEVQVFADTHGSVIHLGERDCSLQRRHQKVIEEAPAPGVTPELRAAIGAIAVRAAKAIGYVGAGTVEFIADAARELSVDAFAFMEMNTRLQVEHPVTEAVTELDLVEWQLRVAAGEPLALSQTDVAIEGHAFEARLYAEDVPRGFLPATGPLHHLALPHELARVDSGVRHGDVIGPHYDPMIAKIVVHGASRAAALHKLRTALEVTHIAGTVTNAAFLLALAKHPAFQQGEVDTGLIERDLPMLIAQPPPPREVVAVAAISALSLARPSHASGGGRSDPWSTLAGWRHWSTSRQFAYLEHAGRHLDIRVAGQGTDAFRIGDADGAIAVAIVECRDDGALRVETGGRIVAAHAVEFDGRLSVHCDGQTWVFGLPDRLAADEDDDAVSDRVTSPMPGLIKDVAVKSRAGVVKGQPLVVIEAMKMEYTMTAPRDGRIAEVFVRSGDNVQSGALLLALEPDSGG